ncbi:MAG: N-glycosylase, partial [Candidatus ainarchaeum sp.]|nr:N-glycosylase [Candidatus ainarchaeum sp.]
FSLDQLSNKLKEYGHRFPNTRANFICLSRIYKDNLKEELFKNKTEENKREWLVKNIKGLGYKEASHFLRNIGYKDLAIIDFHIIDILVDNKKIEKPKTITKAKYLEIENILRKLGKKVNLSLAELDLYLWFLETGKIYK